MKFSVAPESKRAKVSARFCDECKKSLTVIDFLLDTNMLSLQLDLIRAELIRLMEIWTEEVLWTYFSSVWLTALSLPSLLDLACALCSPYALVCGPCDVLHRLHGDSRICTIPDMNDSTVLGLLIVLQNY